MAKAYCSRDFSERVTVQSPTYVDDGFGGKTKTWATKTKIFCMIEDRNGSEGVNAGRIEDTGGATFTTPYRSDLLTTDRLLVEGVEYNIRSIVDVDRKKRWLRIIGDFGVRN